VFSFMVEKDANRGIWHVVDVLYALSQSLGDSRTALFGREADERSMAAELVQDQCST
jgi:hypothetical protein